MGEITIPIKEEVYKALLMEKKDKESLSEVILRLSRKNLCIEDIVGTRILAKEDWDEVKLELKKFQEDRGINDGRVVKG